jgi:SAM-dependent methyltransferase
LLRRLEAWHGLNKRRRFVERWVAGGTLLDVGCGNGELLACFARTGRWRVVGTEIVPSAAKASAARHRLPVVLAAADAPAPFQASSFDAICLWDVLEHLHDPRTALTEARRLIKPAGLLIITTPDVASLQARLFGPSWQGYDAPRHLWLFSRTTLLRLLAETGWSAVEVSAFTGAPQTFLLSLGWWLKGWLGPRAGPVAARLVQSGMGRIVLAFPLWVLARIGLTSHICVAARPVNREPVP